MATATLAVAGPPEQGQLVNVRQRQWVVSEVVKSTLPSSPLRPSDNGAQHLVSLSSVEDDALGEELQVIWELEPGAQVIEKVALPEPTGFDPPDRLDAFLDAVRWGAASTADVKNIQASFRDDIDIEDHSLRLFAFEEPLTALWVERVVANEAAEGGACRQAGVRLIKMLRRYQECWPGELSELARHLREFADALDMRGKKKARG